MYFALFRNEIRSGTAVTYNDRQEILCQSCTDATLHERGVEDSTDGGWSQRADQTTPTNERADRQPQVGVPLPSLTTQEDAL